MSKDELSFGQLSVRPVIKCQMSKSCPNIISLVKLLILTPLQKLPKNVGGELIAAKGFEKLLKVQ